MNTEFLIAAGIQLFGVTIAAFSQLFLKTSANKTYTSWWRQLVNWRVILAYAVFLVSTLCSLFALRVLPLTFSGLWSAFSQLLVFTLSILVLKEKVTKRAVIGVAIIVVGIFVFAL